MKVRNFTITVFGSARVNQNSPDYKLAYELGKFLAKAGYTLCNGGYGGTMEASAHGAKDSGGKTMGVVTKYFSTETNPFIDRKIVVQTLNERLLKLIEVGDAYVILKGGTGTLVELATVWEYMNKDVIEEKPVIALGPFWSTVIDTVKRQLLEEGLTSAVERVIVIDSPKGCVRVLQDKLKNVR